MMIAVNLRKAICAAIKLAPAITSFLQYLIVFLILSEQLETVSISHLSQVSKLKIKKLVSVLNFLIELDLVSGDGEYYRLSRKGRWIYFILEQKLSSIRLTKKGTCVCGYSGKITIHHLFPRRHFGNGNGNQFYLPLCAACHNELECKIPHGKLEIEEYIRIAHDFCEKKKKAVK